MGGNPVKKWAKYINRFFSKEDIMTAKRYMKTCLILLIIREMQNKTTIRHCLIPIRMSIIKKSIRSLETSRPRLVYYHG